MADSQTNEQPTNEEAQTGPLCRHIRSKGMYVYTDGVDMGFVPPGPVISLFELLDSV
jgi:hypothetical protein